MAQAQADLSQVGRQLFASTIASTSAGSDLDAVIRRSKAAGRPYTDPDFPPDAKSLIKDWKTSPRARVWQRYVWRRATEFMNRPEMAVFKGIDPNDIRQGSMGNCYFLSALSVLAEHGQRISKLFPSDQINDSGAYGVYVNKNGAWNVIVVDDYFPCSSPSAGPSFSKSNGPELWVLLLEKAWAKIHGSYEKIELGLTKDVLRDLTGAPCMVFTTDDPEAWNKLLDAESKKYLLTASAGNTKASQQLIEQMGLIGQHAYAILDVQAVTTATGPARLLKMRNPWGNREWSGDWSDESPLWTPALKAQLGYSKANDGSFWISFEDFSTYFSFITICLINDAYVDTCIVRTVPQGQRSLISMTVPSRAQLYLSLNQIDKRTNPDPTYAYSDAKFVVAKRLETGEFEYIYGKQSSPAGDRNVWEGGIFEPGTYVISVDINWKGTVNEFSFSTYGAVEPVLAAITEDIPTFLEQAYASAAVKFGKRADYAAQGAPELAKYTGVRADGYGFFHYVNASSKALHETVTFKKFTGLQLLPPHSGGRFEVTVQPGCTATVMLKQIDHKGYSMSYSAAVGLTNVVVDLEANARSQGTKSIRKDGKTGQEVNIWVYTLRHAGGTAFLYENRTDSKRLDETITFRTTGVQIVGCTTDKLRIELGPGQTRLVELRAVEANWSVQTSVSYKII